MTSSSIEDIDVELIRLRSDIGCPAGGTEHKPTFITSLLHSVKFTLL